MNVKDFWYIATPASALSKNRPVGVKILGEWIAVFRDESGTAVAIQDKCIHRCAQLSRGTVTDGKLQCPYHGWIYGGSGQVMQIPSEGPDVHHKIPKAKRQAVTYPTLEQDGYIYVRPNPHVAPELENLRPFRIPFLGEKGWMHIRLINRFENNVTNCAENFVDIPHTTFVHPGIFRNASHRKISATVERKDGSVLVEYHGEKSDFGIFSLFLNQSDNEIGHSDHFHMPNVTSVDYRFSEKKRFFITSQSIPTTEEETLVYTDLTYNYGIFNWISRPLVRWQAQAIIDQDVEILKNQMNTIRKHGDDFTHTDSDVIHIFIESIREELGRNRDPRELPHRKGEIEFWV